MGARHITEASAVEVPALLDRWRAVRGQTDALAAPLSAEDAQAQSMPDASPAKWHLAHTTWFLEAVLLQRFEPGYRPFMPGWHTLFNSYYEALGPRHPRPQRGLLTRPTLQEVRAWRAQVDERITKLCTPGLPAEGRTLLELAAQHEQQHQELLLTDVLHLLSCNPLQPAYAPMDATGAASAAQTASPLRWATFDGGLVDIGLDAGPGFCFDNESPRHRRWLAPYALAQRPVSQGEWRDFIADGGYEEPRWWLSAGWDWVRAQGVQAPLYWQRDGDNWQRFTLRGLQPLCLAAPVAHLSFYEAEAYARWAGAQQPGHTGRPAIRLPTEAEWEHAVALRGGAVAGNLLEGGALDTRPADDKAGGADAGLQQAWGDVWEWTRSSYEPYPGYRPWAGAVGEYNGKFMADQFVLRGGSCATPRNHLRASYRNFFPAPTRWQFAGLRLARDAG